MQNITQNITFRVSALLLMLAVLLPSAIKLNHVFENHKHEVCTEHTKTHFHAIDLDCEFYKFNLNTHFFNLSEYNQTTFEDNYLKTDLVFYNFIKNHQQLSFTLRGPPFLV